MKFHNTSEQLADREAYIRAITRVVTPVEAVAAVVADPADDRILECAVAADAGTVVSGDKHLLAIGGFRGIRIMRVADFLAEMQAHGR